MYSETEHQHIFKALLSSTPAVIGVKDLRGRYLVVNEQYKRLFDHELTDFIGKTLDEALPDHNLSNAKNDDWASLLGGKPTTIEESVLIKGKETFFLTVKFPILDDNGKIFALGIIATDITERKIMEQKLAQANLQLEQKVSEISELKERLYQQSIRDPLTNLFNRRYLDNALTREIRLANENDDKFSVVMIDLDNFKGLNDQYGHLFGDQVLQNFSQLMTSQLDSRQLLARTGGEEFMLVLPRTSAAQAFEITENLRELYAKMAHPHNGQNVFNSFSAGIAEYPTNAEDLKSLLQRSDSALYTTKGSGRNKTIVFK